MVRWHDKEWCQATQNRQHEVVPSHTSHHVQAGNAGLRQRWAAERAARRTNCFHIAVICRLSSLIAGCWPPLVHDGLLNGVTGKQAHDAGGPLLTCKGEEWRCLSSAEALSFC